MTSPRIFYVFDESGDPKTDAVPMVASYVTKAGVARVAPTITNLGDGSYSYEPSGADETLGCIIALDCGAGTVQRYQCEAVYLGDGSNAFLAYQPLDLDAFAPTTGAPTVGSYVNLETGLPETPPAVVQAGALELYSVTPPALAAATLTGIRLDGPAGAYPRVLFETFALLGTSSVGLRPDVDLATHLASATAPDLGTLGADVFWGPVRPPVTGLVPHAAIFVLATGGPAPDPYFAVGGVSASFYRAGVQVRIRSEVDTYEAGLTKALQVRNKAHLADLTGYVACKVRESTPLYLGRDDTEHHEWAVNVEVWFKQ